MIKDTFKTHSEISEVRKNSYKFTGKPSRDEAVFDSDFALSEETKTNQDPASTAIARAYRAKLKSVVAEKERVQIELRQKVRYLRNSIGNKLTLSL